MAVLKLRRKKSSDFIFSSFSFDIDFVACVCVCVYDFFCYFWYNEECFLLLLLLQPIGALTLETTINSKPDPQEQISQRGDREKKFVRLETQHCD